MDRHKLRDNGMLFRQKKRKKKGTHLSTESNGRFSGGGRDLSFLGRGVSLSDCRRGRAGSAPDGGNGEEEVESFHSVCERSTKKSNEAA